MASGKKYRIMAEELFSAGTLCKIVRVSAKNYALIINFEVFKTYRKRESCNRQLSKLHEKQNNLKENTYDNN